MTATMLGIRVETSTTADTTALRSGQVEVACLPCLKGQGTNLACLPDRNGQQFMYQSLMTPFMQAAHACCQGVQDADQLLDLLFIPIPQGLLFHGPDLIHQAAHT